MQVLLLLWLPRLWPDTNEKEQLVIAKIHSLESKVEAVVTKPLTDWEALCWRGL